MTSSKRLESSPVALPETNKKPDAAWEAIALLIIALIMGAVYFGLPGSWDALAAQRDIFYGRLSTNMLVTSAGELDAAFNSAEPDGWSAMLLRAALVRYRLRNEFPRPWELLMRKWDDALIALPAETELLPLFERYDANWRWARQTVLSRPPENLRLGVDETRQSLKLDFKDRPPTPAIGSYVRLVFEVPRGQTPDQPPMLLWGTEKQPPHIRRRRLGMWSRLDEPAERSNCIRIAVDFDFSWEPGWIASGARLGGFIFKYPEGSAWKFVRPEFGDSPYLTVDVSE